MARGKGDFGPFLLKFGFAVAFSFAGFLYSRFRARTIKPAQTVPSPPPKGDDDAVGSEKQAGVKDELNGLQITPSSYEDGVENPGHTTKATCDLPIVDISPCSNLSKESDNLLLPQLDELIKEFDTAQACMEFSPKKDVQVRDSNVESAQAFSSMGKGEHEQENKHLRNVVRILRERERSLEIELLEYYGLKEQETAVMELKNRLKINTVETKLFSLKIESLQADNRRLEAQVADQAKVVAELEAARVKIKSLKKKLRYDAELNKEQILKLQQRVAKLQGQEHKVSDNTASELQLQRLKELENELEELRESNMRLQQENIELDQRLESAQILATSVLVNPEVEVLKKETQHLKEENVGLAKEIERLQADRCADVEELVYLRWINACLRYELRNYQPSSGRTVARDLSKSLSPKSEEKAKQLILEYANSEGMGERGGGVTDFDSDQWSSSQASYVTDSGEFDESFNENSSAAKTNSSSKMKFFSKLRRLVRGKGSHHKSHHSSVDKITSPREMQVTSPQYSSGISTATDAQSTRFNSPFLRTSSVSFDNQRRRSLNLEDIKNLENSRKNSCLASSSDYKRFLMGDEGDSNSPRQKRPHQDLLHSVQNSELVKYAAALRDRRSGTLRLHKRSASFSSF